MYNKNKSYDFIKDEQNKCFSLSDSISIKLLR